MTTDITIHSAKGNWHRAVINDHNPRAGSQHYHEVTWQSKASDHLYPPVFWYDPHGLKPLPPVNGHKHYSVVYMRDLGNTLFHDEPPQPRPFAEAWSSDDD